MRGSWPRGHRDGGVSFRVAATQQPPLQPVPHTSAAPQPSPSQSTSSSSAFATAADRDSGAKYQFADFEVDDADANAEMHAASSKRRHEVQDDPWLSFRLQRALSNEPKVASPPQHHGLAPRALPRARSAGAGFRLGNHSQNRLRHNAGNERSNPCRGWITDFPVKQMAKSIKSRVYTELDQIRDGDQAKAAFIGCREIQHCVSLTFDSEDKTSASLSSLRVPPSPSSSKTVAWSSPSSYFGCSPNRFGGQGQQLCRMEAKIACKPFHNL